MKDTFYRTSLSLEKGFTLVEVMIALAIIAATLTVALYTVNYHAGISYENSVKTQMLLYAKERLVKLDLDRRESEGKIEGTDFTYKNEISGSAVDEVVTLNTSVKGADMEFNLRKLSVKKDARQNN
ncbi:MAG: prepilin-type N-terminal cleavage/methylation domain-containing protein [Nitrospirae bacterium]|nr:prepilin-type N-terminal cleavage/methylation domain-containing protein [Nitrospirota bacterium]